MGLLERVAKKTESVTIGPMPKLKDHTRDSMTECIASFFAASEKLKSVDFGKYIENNKEALTMLSSLKQSESVSSIEHLKIYNKDVEISEELVEEHAQFFEITSALKNLDTAGKDMKASSVAILLTALSQSESFINFESIPEIPYRLYSSSEV